MASAILFFCSLPRKRHGTSAEILILKGHGFSRADHTCNNYPDYSPEGMRVVHRGICGYFSIRGLSSEYSYAQRNAAASASCGSGRTRKSAWASASTTRPSRLMTYVAGSGSRQLGSPFTNGMLTMMER